MNTVPFRRSARVLVVEAHEDTRSLYAESLRASGFSVEACCRVDDAMKRANTADAIVTGLCIERWMDGVEFIARVRASEARVPIFVVTAHGQGRHPSTRDRGRCGRRIPQAVLS